MTLYEDLVWRGLVQEISSPELIDKLNKGGLTFYIGTDPTADSMHIGHYSSFLICRRLANAGHHPQLHLLQQRGKQGEGDGWISPILCSEQGVGKSKKGSGEQWKDW